MEKKNTVPMLEKAMDLLEYIGASDSSVTLPELQKNLGIAQASCYRIASTLLQRGWLEKRSGYRYEIAPGRLYRDYAVLCINLVEEIYCREEMRGICDYVESNWYSTTTPLGAELEFSYLGARAVSWGEQKKPKHQGCDGLPVWDLSSMIRDAAVCDFIFLCGNCRCRGS